MASNNPTTSSISGLLSGFPSQHLFITLANELGQHFGISEGEIRVRHVTAVYLPQADAKAIDITFSVVWVVIENLR
ncbi:unnamed protein product [Spirodela intermedia]|uniref:Uncharacterized protein n=1 Tax=Spirodela intermedia TaxID=51605 RepID=A0A7I8LJV5_SPIIN|nr:unnamed protein product [Spirodela intermedia]